MREIIEDTITRNREFRKERMKRLEKLRELNAPEAIIDYEEQIANMTLAEYDVFMKEQEEERKKIISEYAKNNPLKKEIVDKIYEKANVIEHDEFCAQLYGNFLMKLHPLEFMSMDDYEHELYESFLRHAWELYGHSVNRKHELDIR